MIYFNQNFSIIMEIILINYYWKIIFVINICQTFNISNLICLFQARTEPILLFLNCFYFYQIFISFMKDLNHLLNILKDTSYLLFLQLNSIAILDQNLKVLNLLKIYSINHSMLLLKAIRIISYNFMILLFKIFYFLKIKIISFYFILLLITSFDFFLFKFFFTF